MIRPVRQIASVIFTLKAWRRNRSTKGFDVSALTSAIEMLLEYRTLSGVLLLGEEAGFDVMDAYFQVLEIKRAQIQKDLIEIKQEELDT